MVGTNSFCRASAAMYRSVASWRSESARAESAPSVSKVGSGI